MSWIDKIATSDPVDKKARSVISMGTHGPDFGYEAKHVSETPIETADYKGPDRFDLTGFKFDDLTVVGYFGSSKSKGSMWVCKCLCGNYLVTPRKRLLNQNRNACAYCIERDALLDDEQSHYVRDRLKKYRMDNEYSD